MVNFPQIKKKVNAFLVGEEGKISKESLIKTGAILSVIALGALKSVRGAHDSSGDDYSHTNNMRFERTTEQKITGVHRNEMHGQVHSSHASHASHCAGIGCHAW